MINEFKQYKRKGLSEMRPYVAGENLSSISVSDTDDPINDMGMIARNPKNPLDQWYVARKYFDDNLELISDPVKPETTFLERLLKERSDLENKWAGLSLFIDLDDFKQLSKANRDLLIMQLTAMESYLTILNIRIELNSK